MWIIQIDDEVGGWGIKIYLTSWGFSVWKDYAKRFNKSDAEIRLSEYLKTHQGETGRIINYETDLGIY